MKTSNIALEYKSCNATAHSGHQSKAADLGESQVQMIRVQTAIYFKDQFQYLVRLIRKYTTFDQRVTLVSCNYSQ